MRDIIFYEGVHCSGKTFRINKYDENKYDVITENFCDNDNPDKQNPIFETMWCSSLCNQLKKWITSKETKKNLVVDRSPYSSYVYVKQIDKKIMLSLIDGLMKELEIDAKKNNVQFKIILLKRDKELIKYRAYERQKLGNGLQNECDETHINDIITIYDSEILINNFKKYCSLEIDTSFI